MDETTKRYDAEWLDAPDGGGAARTERHAVDERTSPTAELDLPYQARSGSPASASDAETERWDTPRASDPPTRRLEEAPTQRLSAPPVTPSEYERDSARTSLPQRSANRGRTSAPAQVPAPAPAPVPPPRQPIEPIAEARAPRPPGPNAVARIGAVLLAPPLALIGAALVAYALLLTVLEFANATAQSLIGLDVVALAGAELRSLILIGGVVALALAALSARLSGAGVGVAGVLALVAGLVSLVWPSELATWLFAQPWMPSISGAEQLANSVITLAATLFGVVALVVGAALLAVAGAVHGARQAGWDRGRGA